MNHDDIERRAYELYESRGREDGRDLDDWLQAERESGTKDQEARQRAVTNTATPSPARRRVDQRDRDTASAGL